MPPAKKSTASKRPAPKRQTPKRQTKQRDVIRRTIDKAGRPLAPLEILEIAGRKLDTLSLATVYRAVKALLEEGFIAEVHLPGENPRYERADRGHHHHFHCNTCQRAFDLTECPGDAIDRMAPPGFAVETHDITLFGECADCADSGDDESGTG